MTWCPVVILAETRLYTKDHEWLETHDDGTATIGITQYAQEKLGDIVFVQLPEIGSMLKKGGKLLRVFIHRVTFVILLSLKSSNSLLVAVQFAVHAKFLD